MEEFEVSGDCHPKADIDSWLYNQHSQSIGGVLWINGKDFSKVSNEDLPPRILMSGFRSVFMSGASG